MSVMGLDVSTKSTGWFISKRAMGLITIDPAASLEDKLCYFRDELVKLLEKYRPEIVVIEDTYLRFHNPLTLKQLARFSGVAIEACARSGAKVKLITATQARKNCCGKQGKDFKKPEVFKYFTEKYELTSWKFDEHNDISDAWALAASYKNNEKQKSIEKKGDKKKK